MVYAHRQSSHFGGRRGEKKKFKNEMVWVFNPLTVSLVSHSDFDEDSPAEWLEIHKIKKKMRVQIKC